MQSEISLTIFISSKGTRVQQSGHKYNYQGSASAGHGAVEVELKTRETAAA